MRILFTFAGGLGHFTPLIPLARAAEAAGHEIAFGGQPGLLPSIAQAGFMAFDTAGVSFGDASSRGPLLALDSAREDRAVRDGYAGRIATARAAAIAALCALWKPDLLVSDEMDFGASVAAERHPVPHARVLVIATGALARPAMIAAPLNALRATYGLPHDPDLAMLTRPLLLSPFPPSLRDPAFTLPDAAFAYRVSKTPGATPACLRDLAPRPTIYATLGTVFNVESGDLFHRLLDGLSRLAVNAVLTAGPQIDPGELGPIPTNIRVERFIDQDALLPSCDLVVSHGGSGTMLGALAHGLPMVLLPMGADQPHNARRCEALGVARVLDPVAMTPESLSGAIAAVLADPSCREAAQKMRDEIAALPDQGEAVARLERLTAR